MYVRKLKWVTHSHHPAENHIAFPYLRDRLEAPCTKLEGDHQAVARILVNFGGDRHWKGEVC